MALALLCAFASNLSSMTGAVVVSTDLLHRTGLLLWRGARDFCRWLHHCASPSTIHTVLLRSGGVVVAELGGGMGIGAIATALKFSSSVRSYTTDFYPPALELARSLVRLNGNGSTAVVELDWMWSSTHEGRERLRSVFDEMVCFSSQGEHTNTNVVLLGLDVVYPDTRDDVLYALFRTVHLLLLTRNCTDASSSFFLCSFIERDVGFTLRRLFQCVAQCGLQITPWLTPFSSADVPDTTLTWDDVREDFVKAWKLACGDTNKLLALVSRCGSWCFSINLADEFQGKLRREMTALPYLFCRDSGDALVVPSEAILALVPSTDGTALVLDCNVLQSKRMAQKELSEREDQQFLTMCMSID